MTTPAPANINSPVAIILIDPTTGLPYNANGGGGTGITALTQDVTASGSGSVAATVVGINDTLLSGLATGLIKNTTGTGVPTIAVAGTDYVAPGSSPSCILWSATGIAAGTTNFIVPGQNAATSANASVPVVRAGTISTMYVHIVTAPATSQSVSFTLFYGAAGSLASTALTCSVAAAANAASDTTHSVSVTTGNYFSVQVITGATNATGNIAIGLVYTS